MTKYDVIQASNLNALIVSVDAFLVANPGWIPVGAPFNSFNPLDGWNQTIYKP